MFINRGGYIAAHESVRIGDGCLIGEYVTVHDDDHVFGPSADPEWHMTPPADRGLVTAPIVIGRNVWLGTKVTVTKGVEIRGRVRGGGKLRGDEEPPCLSLAAGAPARVIRSWAIDAPGGHGHLPT